MNHYKCLAACLSLMLLLPICALSDEPGAGANMRATSTGNTPLEIRSNGLEQAKGEQLATAIGHFGRARSLLIAAIQEFDEGCKFANPKVLLNVETWRNNIMDRTEDLDRVLAPQARVTKGGVQYQSDTRLLHGSK